MDSNIKEESSSNKCIDLPENFLLKCSGITDTGVLK